MFHRTVPSILAASLAVPFALAGCTPSETESSGTPGPALQADAMYTAGPVKVESGQDTTICSYVRSDSDSDEDVVAFLTDQSKGGHHLIVYTVDHAIDAAPHRCSQGGQPGWSQVIATQLESEKITFPEGVGFHVKAHQQYVMETHFINTTEAEIDVTSHFGVVYAEPGAVKQRAGTYFFGTMNIDVPPNGSFEKTAECHPPRDMTLHTMFGHQHRTGTSVGVLLGKGGEDASGIYESTDWEAPEIHTFDSGLPITPADVLSVTCKWDNATPERLRFPHEMCYAIGYFWPADAGIYCASGGGKDTCECREQGNLDTGPGGAAVKVTVTRKAEISGAGGEVDTGAPIYCALFRAEDYTALGPKAGAQPLYFRDAVDVKLASDKDTATFDIQDVTPGDYAVSCVMDVIGGGFMPGKGDLFNLAAPTVSVKKGDTAHVDVTLDLAIP